MFRSFIITDKEVTWSKSAIGIGHKIPEYKENPKQSKFRDQHFFKAQDENNTINDVLFSRIAIKALGKKQAPKVKPVSLMQFSDLLTSEIDLILKDKNQDAKSFARINRKRVITRSKILPNFTSFDDLVTNNKFIQEEIVDYYLGFGDTQSTASMALWYVKPEILMVCKDIEKVIMHSFVTGRSDLHYGNLGTLIPEGTKLEELTTIKNLELVAATVDFGFANLNFINSNQFINFMLINVISRYHIHPDIFLNRKFLSNSASYLFNFLSNPEAMKAEIRHAIDDITHPKNKLGKEKYLKFYTQDSLKKHFKFPENANLLESIYNGMKQNIRQTTDFLTQSKIEIDLLKDKVDEFKKNISYFSENFIMPLPYNMLTKIAKYGLLEYIEGMPISYELMSTRYLSLTGKVVPELPIIRFVDDLYYKLDEYNCFFGLDTLYLLLKQNLNKNVCEFLDIYAEDNRDKINSNMGQQFQDKFQIVCEAYEQEFEQRLESQIRVKYPELYDRIQDLKLSIEYYDKREEQKIALNGIH